jgi:hypothetical protein
MKSITGLLTIAALIAMPAVASAAVCADIAPAATAAPASGSEKCAAAIAKAGSSFVKAKMKAEIKCIAKTGTEDPTACPTAKDAAKVQKAVVKAQDGVAKACDAAAISGLPSSVNAVSGGVIASCMLSQHNVDTAMIIGESVGPATSWKGGKDRAKCGAAVNKAATSYVTGYMKTANKCMADQAKAGTPGDLSPICIGSWSGGVFVAPTDAKTADKLAKLLAKTEGGIQKKCGDNPIAAVQIKSLFGCRDAVTVDDLKNCVVCTNFGYIADMLEQQYAETGIYATGTLQDAVDAAVFGDKILLPADATYMEEVVISTDGISLVGCGGASDNRPQVTAVPAATGNGITSTGVSDLLFQSIKMVGQESNGIFSAVGDNLV